MISRSFVVGSVSLAVVLSGVSGVMADAMSSLTSARYLCALVDATGLSSRPCSVSGWNATVNLTLDMNVADARAACSQIRILLSDKGYVFDDGWTLNIYSPYSGDSTIAFCAL